MCKAIADCAENGKLEWKLQGQCKPPFECKGVPDLIPLYQDVTPLTQAILQGNETAVPLLIKSGADVNVRLMKELTFTSACTYFEGKNEVQSSVTIPAGTSLIHLALKILVLDLKPQLALFESDTHKKQRNFNRNLAHATTTIKLLDDPLCDVTQGLTDHKGQFESPVTMLETSLADAMRILGPPTDRRTSAISLLIQKIESHPTRHLESVKTSRSQETKVAKIIVEWNNVTDDDKAGLITEFLKDTGHEATLEAARGSEFAHDGWVEIDVYLYVHHTRGLDGDLMLPAGKGGDAVGPAPWVVRWKDTPLKVCMSLRDLMDVPLPQR